MFLLAGVVVVALIGAAVLKNVGPSKYDDFAQCLAEKGAFVYEAWWCSACAAQEEQFGTAYRHVPKKECAAAGQSSSFALCEEDGITSTPTWRYPDGSLNPGVHPMSALSEIYGCELPQ